MRLYWYGFWMLVKKFILRQNTGKVICEFAERMGVVYIKVAQILAMQNVGTLFTESDREKLLQICDHCNPIPFSQIQAILRNEYSDNYMDKFQGIDETPLGSASISQVHRAVLRNGEVVALKIRRRDITRRIMRDVKQIRKLIHRFGKFAKFRNFFGSDKALECYVDWIFQETDFEHEQQNIRTYHEFADSVNGKIKHIHTKISVPKLYSDLCTPNIIAMEYISAPTVNQLPLTPENKQRIATAENDYIELSFYALLHKQTVVFHGDPHGGNIYLDGNNLGFLDMGLIFKFSPEEAELTRELFLSSYLGKTERIVDLLFQHSALIDANREQLIRDMSIEIQKIRDIPVAQFFVEMIGIFTQHNIAVPDFLFKMAKAFLALFGLGTITDNHADVKSLLSKQISEFYFNRTFDDVKQVVRSGARILPDFLSTTLRDGPMQGAIQQVNNLASFSDDCHTTLINFAEALELLNSGTH